MKITITMHEFVDRFQRIRPDSFSRSALKSIFEHLESVEQDTGEEIEFDPIAICCDFAEYESATEAKRSREGSNETEEPTEEQESRALAWLYDQTTVFQTDSGSVVVQDF